MSEQPLPLRGQAADAAKGAREERWRSLGPEAPVVSPSRVRDRDAAMSSFGDVRWLLDPMGRGPGEGSTTIHFALDDTSRPQTQVPPACFEGTLKRLAYLLINEPTPRAMMERARSTAVEWLSPSTVRSETSNARMFMDWLARRGCTAFADTTSEMLDEYRLDVDARSVQADRKFALLSTVERIAHLAPLLPVDDRLPDLGEWDASAVLRMGRAAPGSRREVIDPDTLDPLLVFTVACVRSIAPDILAAHDTAVRLAREAEGVAKDWGRARALVAELADQGIPARDRKTRVEVAAAWLAVTHGVDASLISSAVNVGGHQQSLDAAIPTPVPEVEVRGRIGDHLWCSAIDWYDVAPAGQALPPLLRNLQAACFVAICMLSGARPEEVRTLPIDALDAVPAREPGGAVRFVLNGSKRKRVRDDDGFASLEGEPGQWVTVGPGADAARVAAELARRIDPDSKYLFPGGRGAVKHPTMAKRVQMYYDWIDAVVVQAGLPDAYRLPPDSEAGGRLAGFRRTLGWHIRNQPGGELALAVQYHHADPAFSGDGYASVADVGVRRVMDRAAREAHDRMMDEVAQSLISGTRVSGPAAERLVEAAALRHPILATYVTDKEAAHVAQALDAPVFDNPDGYSLCVFVPRSALCLTGEGDAEVPDRGACVATCGCHARTDQQVDKLRSEIERHHREAASPLTPEPLAKRLMAVADRKTARVADHERTGAFVSLETLQRSMRREA